jgi:hypothetical protein
VFDRTIDHCIGLRVKISRKELGEECGGGWSKFRRLFMSDDARTGEKRARRRGWKSKGINVREGRIGEQRKRY